MSRNINNRFAFIVAVLIVALIEFNREPEVIANTGKADRETEKYMGYIQSALEEPVAVIRENETDYQSRIDRINQVCSKLGCLSFKIIFDK